jgi:hypothetical protein
MHVQSSLLSLHMTRKLGPLENAMRARWRESYSRLNPKPKVLVSIKINDLTPKVVPLPLNIGSPIPDYRMSYGAIPAGKPRIDDFIRAACRHFDVTRGEFLSARRPKKLFLPRQVAAYLARTMTDHSLPEIARRFGGRDHTTIMHSVEKIERLLKNEDEAIRGHVEAVKSEALSLCGAYQSNRSAPCSYHQTPAQ